MSNFIYWWEANVYNAIQYGIVILDVISKKESVLDTIYDLYCFWMML